VRNANQHSTGHEKVQMEPLLICSIHHQFTNQAIFDSLAVVPRFGGLWGLAWASHREWKTRAGYKP
jgi:hypothetical protein